MICMNVQQSTKSPNLYHGQPWLALDGGFRVVRISPHGAQSETEGEYRATVDWSAGS